MDLPSSTTTEENEEQEVQDIINMISFKSKRSKYNKTHMLSSYDIMSNLIKVLVSNGTLTAKQVARALKAE